MTATHPAPARVFVFTASLAAVGVVIDLILLGDPTDKAVLVVLKYPLALAVALAVLAAGRAIRRAEAACLEDLQD